MPIKALVVYEDVPINSEEDKKPIIFVRKRRGLRIPQNARYSTSSEITLLGEGMRLFYGEAFRNGFNEDLESGGFFFGNGYQFTQSGGNSYHFVNVKKSFTLPDETRMDLGIYTICDELDNPKVAKRYSQKLLNQFINTQYKQLHFFKQGAPFKQNQKLKVEDLVEVINYRFSALNKISGEKIQKSQEEGKLVLADMDSAIKRITNKDSSHDCQSEFNKGPIKNHFHEVIIYDKEASHSLYTFHNGIYSSVNDVELKSGKTTSISLRYKSITGSKLEFFGGGGLKVILSSEECRIRSKPEKEMNLGIAFICREDDHQPFSLVYSKIILDRFIDLFNYEHGPLDVFTDSHRIDNRKLSEFDNELLRIVKEYSENVSQVHKLRQAHEDKLINDEMKKFKDNLL